MKAIRNILVVSLMAILVANTGCKKYEEGPAFSLRSKKARVVNDWIVVKWLENGEEADLSKLTLEWIFEKDNTGKFIHTIQTVAGTFTSEEDITWDFNDDKTILIVNTVDDNGKVLETTEYTILKLYENEMWLKTENNDDTYEYHLETK